MTDPINRNEVGIQKRIPLDGQTQMLIIKILLKRESERKVLLHLKRRLATYKAAEEHENN